MNHQGTYVELLDEVVGKVVYENEKTLLIRHAFKTVLGEQEIVALKPEATFVSKDLVNLSGLKFLPASAFVSEPVDVTESHELVGKLLNVKEVRK